MVFVMGLRRGKYSGERRHLVKGIGTFLIFG